MRSLRPFAALLAACAMAATSACAGATARSADSESPRVLIVGGGSSHDFPTWFQQADSATLAAAGARVRYTDDPASILERLDEVDALYLSNNQALPDPTLRAAILRLPAAGKGLIIGHAAAWYNWADWPEYNRTLVGGGTRGHRHYGEFTVQVVTPDHPVMEGVPARFTLEDELYRFERDPAASAMTVLATARDEETGREYPIVWTVEGQPGRIVVNTLGHDGKAHDHPAYRRILQNSLRWVTGEDAP